MEKFPFEKHNYDEMLASGIREILSSETPENFIDRGGVGEVFTLRNGYCIKFIEDRHNSPNRHLFDLGNPPLVEMRIQNKVFNKIFNGKTRVPAALAGTKDNLANGKHAVLMEQLPAVNLQHIIGRTAQLPENFDIESFFSDLEEFVSHMHDEVRIIHNDLYARNIMVDLQTAQPYVIDFGRSKYVTELKNDDERKKLINGDWANIQQVFDEINALQI
jgi:serine/threonine protein kinase